MAEGLQVFLIKEKDRIATVWLDVIDIRCKCEAPLLHALLAERVLRNKAITKLLPSIAIPPFCRRTLKSGPTRFSNFTSCSGMLFSIAFMLSTKINTTRYRAPTTGVFAKRHERHQRFSQNPNSKKPALNLNRAGLSSTFSGRKKTAPPEQVFRV